MYVFGAEGALDIVLWGKQELGFCVQPCKEYTRTATIMGEHYFATNCTLSVAPHEHGRSCVHIQWTQKLASKWRTTPTLNWHNTQPLTLELPGPANIRPVECLLSNPPRAYTALGGAYTRQ